MKYILQLFLFCLLSTPLLGQKNISVTGILVEKGEVNIPVEQATIRLLSLPDSSLVSGTTTTKTGGFTIRNISKGNYVLVASYIGFHNLYKQVELSGNPTSVSVGELVLIPDDILLAEAVVVAKANEVVVKNDTIEYNAASFKTEESAVVEDLLKKLPGVEVDSEGKITVGGKEVKKILVEGKEFFSDDPKVASKNLPANMIEKLQVLDQKSDMARMTGFEDGEEQTVINLTVKPGMKKGLVGNVAAGLGHDINSANDDFRFELGGMINQMNNSDRYTLMFGGNNTNNMGASDMGGSRFSGMRSMRRGGSSGIATSENLAFNLNKEFSKKLTLNGDISYGGSDRDVERLVEKTTTSMNKKDSTTFSTIDKTVSTVNDVSDNLGVNLRLEWKPDDNNTLIFRPNFSYNKSNSTQNSRILTQDGLTNDTISEGPSYSYSEGYGHAFGGTLEYAHQFNKLGRVFSISLTGNHNESYSQETYDWSIRYFDKGIYNPAKDSTVNQRSENDNNTNSFRIYTSYVEPLGKNYFLQLAYRISKTNMESVNSTYDMDMYNRAYPPVIALDTAVLNPTQSRSTIRESMEQRFSLNIKSMHEKYNYTIGLNIDPSKSNNKTVQPRFGAVTTEYIPFPFEDRLPNVIGDTVISEIPKNVINFSPTVNFNYKFAQRSSLRIDYEGRTTQPTANQLRDYTDYSNPRDTVRGNPNLKPGYQNELSARFEKFVPATQLFYTLRLNGNFSMNDVGSVATIDPETRNRSTTYENINGNWNVYAMGIFNVPLKNKRFSVNSFTSGSYENKRSYTNQFLNTMKTLSVRERAGINYRSDLFDVGMNLSLNYANTVNEVQPDKNLRTYDWGVMGNTTWYLPHNFSVNTDISWSTKQGYSDGFNLSETIWNASLTKQLFSKKTGTGSLRLKIYDILQDRKSIYRSVGDNYIQDSRTNALQSFFMCSFIYRFNIFPNGSSISQSDFEPSMDRDRSRRDSGGGGSRSYGPPR